MIWHCSRFFQHVHITRLHTTTSLIQHTHKKQHMHFSLAVPLNKKVLVASHCQCALFSFHLVLLRTVHLRCKVTSNAPCYFGCIHLFPTVLTCLKEACQNSLVPIFLVEIPMMAIGWIKGTTWREITLASSLLSSSPVGNQGNHLQQNLTP